MSLHTRVRSVQLPLRQRNKDEFRTAVICALPLEADMVRSVLDEELHDTEFCFAKAKGDNNTYTLGKLWQHNVVLVHMPGMGAVDAANTVAGLRATFTNIDIAFLVGICGASPINTATQKEVYLGDSIVSTAVIQYDFGRQHTGQLQRKSNLEDSLGRAGPTVRSLLAKLQTPGTPQTLEIELTRHLRTLQEKEPGAHYPGLQEDHLYKSTYLHAHHDVEDLCDGCNKDLRICTKDCSEIGCHASQLVSRARHGAGCDHDGAPQPQLHFGRYGSANTVLKSGVHRDRHTETDKIIAFEMEAAGIWESIPTLVIKSACDYADSHKNKRWQSYAAASAAVTLKAIVGRLEVVESLVTHSKFDVPPSLTGVPIAKKFIDRPCEMQKMEAILLPHGRNTRRKLFILRGLGGIGKTQLAVEFMRRRWGDFSAIFWLDGSTVDRLEQSIAQQAGRIPANQISNQSHEYAATGHGDLDVVVAEVLSWLKVESNNRWLLIFDNVDRDFKATDPDPLSYDIKKYIPQIDHGSILITTRLTRLERLGESEEVKKVDDEIARAILTSWHDPLYDEQATQALLERLDGLPLAIAQAGAYMHQKGMGIVTYLRLYDDQKTRVLEALHKSDTLLDDYPNRSVWTTWNISYEAILATNKYAAHLLVLWSFLDRNDLWYGLFEEALREASVKEVLHVEVGHVVDDEISFIDAMSLLRSYSLIEGSERTETYIMHTVVHRWVYFYQGTKHISSLEQLALKIVGCAVPLSYERDYARRQQRLLPHANVCLMRLSRMNDVVSMSQGVDDNYSIQSKRDNLKDYLIAVHRLGLLYHDRGNWTEAERLYLRALTGYEATFETDRAFTLNTVNNLGILYRNQGKLAEAERMCLRALAGYEAAAGAEHTSTLMAVNNLAVLYRDQGKLANAEKMYMRALIGYEAAFGAEHTSTLTAVNNLGILYREQGKLAEAEKMYLRAFAGRETVLGAEHQNTLDSVNNLGNLYIDQCKLAEAEKMHMRALTGRELALGVDHTSTLDSANNLGILYVKQGKLDEAEKMYMRALAGYEASLGADHTSTLATVNNLGIFYKKLGKLAEAEKMLLRAFTGYEQSLGAEHTDTLMALNNLGNLYEKQGKLDRPQEAREMYEKALAGYTSIRGPSDDVCLKLRQRIDELALT